MWTIEHDIIIYSYIYVYYDYELWLYVLVCELVYMFVCKLVYVIYDYVCTYMWIINVCDFRIRTWNSGFWKNISNGSSTKTAADTYY
jgi:hypothetical protein